MWIDSHAHLFDLSPALLTETCTRARSHGVDHCLNVATNLDTSATVIAQCSANSDLSAAVGISPFDVLTLPTDWESILSEYCAQEKVVAIGETGCDKSNPSYPPFELQLPVFQKQCDIALHHNLPIIIHSRGVEGELARRCCEYGVHKALFHCFTGSPKDLEIILKAGYHVSFSGIVTFKNTDMDEIIRMVPEDQLHIETDSPYLAPTPHRGKPNEPAWVSCIGEYVAHARGVSPVKLGDALKKNYFHLFGTKTIEN